MKKFLTFAILILGTTVLLAGCGKKDKPKETLTIEKGDSVTINYTATTETMDAEIIENEVEKEITIGQDKLWNTFDDALIGKKVGDTVSETYQGEKFYSDRFSDGNVQQIPLQVFTETENEVITGQKLDLGNGKGIVTEISDEFVTIDMNPDYLDKDIKFDITIIDIQRDEIENVD